MGVKIWLSKKLFTSDNFLDFTEDKEPASKILNRIAFFVAFFHSTYLLFSGRMTHTFLGVSTCYFPSFLCIVTEILFLKGRLNQGMIFAFICVPLAVTLKGLYEPMTGLMLLPILYGVVCFFLLPTAKHIYYIYLLMALCSITIDLAYHYKFNPDFYDDASLILFNSAFFYTVLYLVLGYLRNLLTEYQNEKILKQTELSIQNKQLQAQQEEIESQNNLLQQRNKLLIESWHFQQKITSVLSHDARTSLIFLKHVVASFEKEKRGDEQLLGFTREMEREITNMNSLFDEVLQWLQRPKNDKESEKKMINLSDIAEEVNYAFKGAAKSKGVLLLNEIEVHQQVYANPEYLKVILRNLVGNALKFTHIDGRIVLSGAASDGMYALCIEDNGIGMSPNNLRKIKQGIEFSTVGTDKEMGIGLGLVFCREFVQKSNGDMVIESTLHHGTKITIRLPLKAKKISSQTLNAN